jgi:hypothetical protein
MGQGLVGHYTSPTYLRPRRSALPFRRVVALVLIVVFEALPEEGVEGLVGLVLRRAGLYQGGFLQTVGLPGGSRQVLCRRIVTAKLNCHYSL